MGVPLTPGQQPDAKTFPAASQSGCIGNIGRVVTRQSQPHIIFGQQHLAHLAPDLWFVFAHPQHLWQGKPGQSGIAGQFYEPRRADPFRKSGALRAGSLIAPDKRRSKHFICFA